MTIPHRAEYLHHRNPNLGANIREAVFGLEDGMVSTLGALTGIAAATQEPFTILLSGLVIVSVESISMAVGSYLSTKSERAIQERKLHEESIELQEYPDEERQELVDMYIQDGWPKALAGQMALAASKNKKLFLQEMAFRELKIIPDNPEQPLTNAFVMGFSYIAGGSMPLVPYLFLPITYAITTSVSITLVGLFVVGALTTKFSHRVWWKAGIEMLVLAGVAAAVGYGVGQAVDWYFHTNLPTF